VLDIACGAVQASPRRSARSGSAGAGGSGGGVAEFAAAHETATSARELSGLRPGGLDSSPDVGGQAQQGGASAPPFNPFSVSVRRMRAAADQQQQQQQQQQQVVVDPGAAAAAYAPVSQAQLTPLWATRGELRQKQHAQHPGRHQWQPPPQQQQLGGRPMAAPPAVGGAALAPAQPDDLRPSLWDAINSLDSAFSHDDPNPPPPQARRRSLSTATAQQLRM
jgi:hypothetical protein